MQKIATFFRMNERGTTPRIEFIAGVTTFMTMAYVLVLQPNAIIGFGDAQAITDATGRVISKEAILIMTALISGLITLLMAFYANLPFALSTGMGSNFMFGALLQEGTLTFEQVMTMTLCSGIVFVLLSALGIRDLIVRMIPKNIKVGISTVIGFFIAYLGMTNSGIVSVSDGLGMGDFTSPGVLVAIFGLLLIAALTAHNVKGAMLIGILVTTLLCIPLGLTTVPESAVKVPNFDTVSDVLFPIDFANVFTAQGLVYMFIAFFGDFFSTLGTVLGVGQKAGMLDDDGNFPDIQKPFLVDAIGTCVGSMTGCTTVTTYVESSAGVEAGGRTGFTSVVTGAIFLIMIFFSPVCLMIPDVATGPALIFVGYMMIQGIQNVDFSDFSDVFGPFIMILFGAYMVSMAAGIAAGILAHVLIKIATGRFREVHPGLYLLCIPLALYFVLS